MNARVGLFLSVLFVIGNLIAFLFTQMPFMLFMTAVGIIVSGALLSFIYRDVTVSRKCVEMDDTDTLDETLPNVLDEAYGYVGGAEDN